MRHTLSLKTDKTESSRFRVKVANLKTGELVYAYSVHKEISAHGKQSSAEACAKHLKDEAVNPK